MQHNNNNNNNNNNTTPDAARQLSSVPAQYSVPAPVEFKPPVDTTAWLLDSEQRDEFCIRHANEMQVFWSDGQRDPILDYGGERELAQKKSWCTDYMEWSPKGSYVATIIPEKGVIVWGGKDYEKLQRFKHSDVAFVEFSPCEKYMMTSWHSQKVLSDFDKPLDAIKIWEVKTGTLLRSFDTYPKEIEVEEGVEPPRFLWSHDDSYIARRSKDMITIYELPGMKLLDKKSLQTAGVADFAWSPGDNIIAYWAPERGNAPAHVDLVQIPSRKALRQKNLFNVSKCNLIWHPQGDFLGVKALRHTKSKKTLYNNLELFRLRDPGIPVEDLKMSDAVSNFDWEPRGSRFAIIHGETLKDVRLNVSFYDMNKTTVTTKGKKTVVEETKELNLLVTLKEKNCTAVKWSPAGGNVVMAGLGANSSGSLEFYDVDNQHLVATKEHYRMNAIFWDPSGRTIASCVTQDIGGGHFKFQMDNGYILWTFQGKQLHQQSFETFYQFAWRPRENMLTKKEKAEVVKNLKRYERQFDKADKERTRQLYLEETAEKRGDRNAFRSVLAKLTEQYNQEKSIRVGLNNGYDSDDDDNYEIKTKTIEVVVSTKTESVQSF